MSKVNAIRVFMDAENSLIADLEKELGLKLEIKQENHNMELRIEVICHACYGFVHPMLDSFADKYGIALAIVVNDFLGPGHLDKPGIGSGGKLFKQLRELEYQLQLEDWEGEHPMIERMERVWFQLCFDDNCDYHDAEGIWQDPLAFYISQSAARFGDWDDKTEKFCCPWGVGLVDMTAMELLETLEKRCNIMITENDKTAYKGHCINFQTRLGRLRKKINLKDSMIAYQSLAVLQIACCQAREIKVFRLGH
jgi:hypothetical protein